MLNKIKQLLNKDNVITSTEKSKASYRDKTLEYRKLRKAGKQKTDYQIKFDYYYDKILFEIEHHITLGYFDCFIYYCYLSHLTLTYYEYNILKEVMNIYKEQGFEITMLSDCFSIEWR